MTDTNDTDRWKRYWDEQYDTGARLQLETAARDPLGHWLVADLRTLAESDVDVDLDDVRRRPDHHVARAREGFKQFVEDAEIDDAADDGYEFLPVHLAGAASAGRGRDRRATLDDPTAAANVLTSATNLPVTDRPKLRTRTVELTYRCPAGHETSLRQPLYRERRLDRCGESDCTNDVFVDDRRTRVRRTVEFTVDHDSGPLRCVATGRYANDGADRIAGAKRLHLTGVLRLVAADDGDVEPIYEVLHAGPS